MNGAITNERSAPERASVRILRISNRRRIHRARCRVAV